MFRKIATYSASLYGATLFTSALSFLVTMVIARRVPKEALGLYGFYATLYSFTGMLLIGGLNNALVKFLADPKEDRDVYTRISLVIAAFLAAFAWPAAVVTWFLPVSPAWPAALVVVPFFVVTVFGNSVFRSAFAKKRELANVCGISLTNSIATLTFAWMWTRPDFAPIAGDMLSYVLPGTIVAAVLLRQSLATRAPGQPFFDRALARRFLAFGWPLSVAGVAFAVYNNASSFLVRGLIGLAALGEYYFALQLMHLMDKPLQILARVVLAGFSARPDLTIDEYKRLVTFNVAFFPALAAAVAFLCPLVLVAADLILAPAAGGEPLAVRYASSTFYVALFALAVPARCVEFLVSSLAIARGRPEVNQHVHVWTAVSSLPVLAALVAAFGPAGAAIMPLCYQALFLTLQARRLRGDMPEIISGTTWAAFAGTLLLAMTLTPLYFGAGVVWMPVAVAAYVLGGHVLRAWDLRLLLPKAAAPAGAEAA